MKVRLLKDFFTTIDNTKISTQRRKATAGLRELRDVVDPEDLYHELIFDVPKQVKSARKCEHLFCRLTT